MFFCVYSTQVCCGTIFKGTNGEVLLDLSLLKPCSNCKHPAILGAQASYCPDTPPESVCSSTDDIPVVSQDDIEALDNSVVLTPMSCDVPLSALSPEKEECSSDFNDCALDLSMSSARHQANSGRAQPANDSRSTAVCIEST